MDFYFWLIQITFICWVAIISGVPKKYTLTLKKINLIMSFVIFFITIIIGITTHYGTLYNVTNIINYNLVSSQINLKYVISIDSLAFVFILLTSSLIPLCMLSAWNNIKYKLTEFLISIILVEWMLINMFMVADLLLFYIWFESILLPMYALIGIWGSRHRKTYASFMFFFYTFIGSLFMLFALLLLYTRFNTLSIFGLENININDNYIIWPLLMIAFAVKVPMFPAHIWLPEAHVEAPTVGSVLLAGILLKLGVFAIIRYIIPMFPEETQYYAPLVSIFALMGILYISLTTIRQTDLKKIIAYASVAHMNYVVLGVLGTNIFSLSGSIFLMVGHGIVSAGLFFLIGFLYDRYRTRNIRYYRGLVSFMPIYAFSFLIFTLANMSFPGTCNFIGEAVILFGLTQSNLLIGWLAAVGIVFCAIYSIWLFNRTMYGPITPMLECFSDMSKKEFTVVLPLLFLTVILGIFPNTIFSIIKDSVSQLLTYYQ